MAETATKKKTYLGTGRRKTSVARVRIAEGTGNIIINGRSLENFFTETKDRNAVLGPLLLTEMINRLDVRIKVHGGGYSGQGGAICQGIARALKDMFGGTSAEPSAPPAAEGQATAPESTEQPTESLFSKKLRDSGYLTRDGRMKERKKYGRKGARKSFQFSKR